MRKILLPLIIGTLGWSFTIKDSRAFSVDKEPDLLTASFYVSYKNDDISEVRKKLKDVKNIVKTMQICKKGGQYRIEPSYKNGKNGSKFKDYHGSMSFSQCDVKDKLDKFDEMINSIKSTDVRISLSPFVPDLSAEVREKLTSDLKVLAIEYAKRDTEKRYSHNCKIKEINFSNNSHVYKAQSNILSSRAMATSSFEPIKSAITLSLFANYEYECTN